MYNDLNPLLVEMREIHEQVEGFFDSVRERFRYTLQDRRVRFRVKCRNCIVAIGSARCAA